MKALFYLIILAAAGYLAWSYHQGTLPLAQIGLPEDSEPPPPAEKTAVTPPAAPAPPVFKSRIATANTVTQGGKKIARPGFFYLLERVTAETKTGVIAAVPGDEVKLVQRNGGKLRVSVHGAEFEVKESQVTNDVAEAQEAERKDFARRNGQR
jgi:hypothetical protein